MQKEENGRVAEQEAEQASSCESARQATSVIDSPAGRSVAVAGVSFSPTYESMSRQKWFWNYHFKVETRHGVALNSSFPLSFIYFF